nr:MAG TPA: hypothetical protein [Caudoviricetes sp.]
MSKKVANNCEFANSLDITRLQAKIDCEQTVNNCEQTRFYNKLGSMFCNK